MEKKNNSLVISEKFYSLQGEGQTMGIPSIFIRLAGCNILCKSEHWVCDSIEVWQKGIKTDFEDVLSELDIERLSQGAHLIWTGGEPMLHQKKINEFVDYLWIQHGLNPVMEIETNGTVMPNEKTFKSIKFFNCSPKLENSGVHQLQRLKPKVIEKINTHPNSIFKFVVDKSSDLVDIINDYGLLVDRRKIVLMPAGEDQEKLEKTRPIVVEACLEQGFKYCDRLHIIIWNQKTGV